MKKIIFLCAITLSLMSFAQNPELFENRWFLVHLNIDGVDYTTPNNAEIPFIELISVSNILSSNICSGGFYGLVNYNASDTFEFTDLTIYLDECELNDNQQFREFYVGFFENQVATIFTYSITTETDASKTLSITNFNGDQVVLTNDYFTPAPTEIEGNWYLYNVIIDGVEHVTPPVIEMDPFSHMGANFWIDTDNIPQFEFYACYSTSGISNFNYSSSEVFLYPMGSTLSDCTDPNYNDYAELYHVDFLMDSSSAPFDFLVATEGQNKILTLTNSNGDKAIYGKTALTIQKQITPFFNVYPNPVVGKLYISSSATTKIDVIKLYNLLGKELQTTTKSEIDMSNYSKGIYFLRIFSNEVEQTIKIAKQ